MRPFVVVVVQIAIEVCLHLLNRFILGRATRNAEVLVQQDAVQPFEFPQDSPNSKALCGDRAISPQRCLANG